MAISFRNFRCCSKALLAIIFSGVGFCASAQPMLKDTGEADKLLESFRNPPPSAAPWVLWYWVHAAVSKQGITADLEAMKKLGIAGAYIATIKDTTNPSILQDPARQLSPEWWEMISWAQQEAKRLDLQLAMHVGDGFAVAGGPWVTPELSMQKLVWSELVAEGNRRISVNLPLPDTIAGYYRDLAVFAYPLREGSYTSTYTTVPEVTTSYAGQDASFLVKKANRESFRSEDPCWIQYAFKEPFLCRSVTICTSGNNYQAQRLLIQVSDDGVRFHDHEQLVPPRHGWQDTDAPNTYAIKPVRAKYFRFVFDKEGSEPGSEDLDAAKWKPVLKVAGIELSSRPRIHQYESKSGLVWRISSRTDASQIADSACVPIGNVVDLTALAKDGKLTWDVPEGEWNIVRIGHTSTGHVNATAGAGKGLEIDKFNPAAVKLQFENWFAKAYGISDAAKDVLKILYVDSWECGSQNWSPVFRQEFLKRRGYDLMPYLLTLTGIPINSADESERILYDVRQTIAELINDNFFGTLAELAQSENVLFCAENVAPTMVSDGMLHLSRVDLPMGEFWYNSPTHDKPNDMLDVISAAHVYGKNIVQAESFTTLRMDWSEHPGLLKPLQDRNYLQGVNRLVYHVFTHSPWLDRKPGMTLDGVGLCFQRGQTWWESAKAWIDYTKRCQALLQSGHHVADIAVFTGDDFPRRALLPHKLVNTLPGLFGSDRVEAEKKRLENKGAPVRSVPDGVVNSANSADPENWVNPLRGYAYDSFNPDALIRLASVKNKKIVLPGGAEYEILIVPGATNITPNATMLSPESALKILQLVREGATVLIQDGVVGSVGFRNSRAGDKVVLNVYKELLGGKFEKKRDKNGATIEIKSLGKGRVIRGAYRPETLDLIGVERDVDIRTVEGKSIEGVGYVHRKTETDDLYFISSSRNERLRLRLSFRVSGKVPEIWNPVNGAVFGYRITGKSGKRMELEVDVPERGSLFIVFRKKRSYYITGNYTIDRAAKVLDTLAGGWLVQFDTVFGGPQTPVLFEKLEDWSKVPNPEIRYYSGTATYTRKFNFSGDPSQRVYLKLGEVHNLAEVRVNGVDCGTVWTAPFEVELTGLLKHGENELHIAVTNTWRNRIMGDAEKPMEERITWSLAPYRLQNKPLLPAGLVGPVILETRK